MTETRVFILLDVKIKLSKLENLQKVKAKKLQGKKIHLIYLYVATITFLFNFKIEARLKQTPNNFYNST